MKNEIACQAKKMILSVIDATEWNGLPLDPASLGRSTMGIYQHGSLKWQDLGLLFQLIKEYTPPDHSAHPSHPA